MIFKNLFVILLMYLCFLIFLKGGQTNFINTVLEGKVKVKKKTPNSWECKEMFALLLTCYTLREVLYHCKYFMIKLNEAAEKQASELIYLLFRMQKVQFVFALLHFKLKWPIWESNFTIMQQFSFIYKGLPGQRIFKHFKSSSSVIRTNWCQSVFIYFIHYCVSLWGLTVTLWTTLFSHHQWFHEICW